MNSWIEEELASLDLGDKRREDRIRLMAARMAEKPQGSILQSSAGWAEAKAAYRALANDAISAEAISAAMRDACVQRPQTDCVILAIQDTTCFDFSKHPATTGNGPLGGGDGSAGAGFFMHSTLAVSADGIPLGLLDQKLWTRDPAKLGLRHQRRTRRLEEKESFRWIESLRAVHQLAPPNTTVISIADREADIFALFAQPRPPGSQLLIRACHNRRVSAEQKHLRAAVAAAPVAGQFTLTLRRAAARRPREASVAVRFRAVTLQPPRHGLHSPALQPVSLTAILVSELAPPAAVPGVEWLLLTDLPVADCKAARECIRYYSLRWLIERYHYTLKSGCRLEASQLRTTEALQRLLALYCLVAWRLLWLTYAARRDGDQPCTVAFSQVEWQTLHRLSSGGRPLPQTPPPLRDAVGWLARLGGFLARRGDGEPGVKVLWRGLMRLQDIVIGVLLLTPPHQDVGKA